MRSSLTKAELVEAISNKLSCPRSDAAGYLESLLETVKSNLAAGEDVKISGFGKFEIKSKNDRIGRNPQTGVQITIDARHIVTFKPSSILKNSLNED